VATGQLGTAFNATVGQENSMPESELKDRMCDHCVSQITKALRAVDYQSHVAFDMLARRVRVAGFDAPYGNQAVRAAGYAPSASRGD
jgi:copper chaperone CopZ